MKKSIFSLIVIAILAMLSGCSESVYNEYYNTKHKKEHKVLPKKVKKTTSSNFAYLTVRTTPKADRIYILNIKPKYKDSIKLKKGKYHIKVVKNGYQTYTKWIDLNKDTTLNITLKKRKDIYIPSKKDYFKYVTDIKWSRTTDSYFKEILYKGKIWAIPAIQVKWEDDNGAYKKLKEINYYGDIKLNDTKVGNLKNFILNGQTAWRLPKHNELRGNPYSKIHKRLYGTSWGHKDSNVIYFAYYDKNKYMGYRKSYYSYLTDKKSGYQLQKFTEDSFLPFILRKDFNKYDKIIFSSLSPIQKLAKLTTLLTQEKLKVKKDKVKKPTKPKKLYPKKLKKGEFEKTADYKKRVEKEKQRVAKLNKQNELKYQQQMIDYKVAVKKAEEKYKKQIAFNKKESTIKKVANEVVSRAITMVFGDPKFKNFKYDADKEQFNATLYSTLNNFSMKVSIPVPLSKAKKFKAKLTDSRLVPSVKFRVKNGKLVFDSVDVVANKIKQKQDFNIAKSKDSIDSYKEFLRYHPTAPQAKKAKKLLQNAKARDAYNDAKYSISKLESFIKAYPHSNYTSKAKSKLADLKERKRRKEERERKERESYYAKKHTGQKVCKKGRVAFGFVGVKISAYVENVRGDDIQLRISSTEGQSINYQGSKLYSGKVIWDTYYNWGSCDY